MPGGAPLGNQNGARGRRWRQAIEAAVDAWPNEPAYDCSGLVNGLRRTAHAFVGKMLEQKDIAFFREFGDRIDGKAEQPVELAGHDGTALIVGWKQHADS